MEICTGLHDVLKRYPPIEILHVTNSAFSFPFDNKWKSKWEKRGNGNGKGEANDNLLTNLLIYNLGIAVKVFFSNVVQYEKS